MTIASPGGAPFPDLPEDFGNPWMSNLQEIGLPEPVPFTPQTAGWYLLAALAVLALAWGLWRLHRRRQADAYRRRALAELGRLEAPLLDPLRRPEAAAALAALVKRAALAAWPRAEVAGLSGDAWLGFLDGSVGSTDFTRGPGRRLPELAYSPSAAAAAGDEEVAALVATVRRWLRRHRAAG